MAALIPNIAKGKWAQLGTLPAASDKLVWVLFTGTETDNNVKDAAHLTALIATVLNEATFAGYARQDAVGATVAVDNASDWQTLDVTTDPQWSPTAAEALTRIALVYDPDGTNTAGIMIPVFVDDFALTTPTSGTITYQVATGGCCKAT